MVVAQRLDEPASRSDQPAASGASGCRPGSRTSTGSPKSGRSRSTIPSAVGSPTCTAAPCTVLKHPLDNAPVTISPRRPRSACSRPRGVDTCSGGIVRSVRSFRFALLGALSGVVALLASLLVLGVATAGGKPVEPPVADPSNDRLGVTLSANGRFSAGAFPDATGAPTTGSYKLLYGWPSSDTSFTTLRVDGADLVYGSGDGTFAQGTRWWGKR